MGDRQWLRFYPTNKGYGGTYFYVIKLPVDFIPYNVETNSVDYCRTDWHTECMSFPDSSYIVVESFVNLGYVQMDIRYPLAISQPNYNIKALVWQGGRYRGIQWITMNSGCQNEFRGTLSSYSGAVTVEESYALTINKRKIQVKMTFVLRHTVPLGGTIQIVWPTGVPAAYPHCRSMTGQGSNLFAQDGSENGEIGCLVQTSRTWVITEFAELSAGSTVIIMGYIDLPGSYGNLGTGEVLSYNGTHPTDIRGNGFIIDYYTDSSFQLYVNNYLSNNIDTEITLEETLPLRVGYVGPLQFKFKLAATLLGPNSGKIRVRIPRRSVWGQLGGFGYESAKKHICKLSDILSHDEYGCIITTTTDDTTTNKESILFEMVTSSTLSTSSTYELLIKPHTGVDPEGLLFPTQPGTYKVDVSFDCDATGNFDIHDQLYL